MTESAAFPTYREILTAPWPKKGLLLPDGRRVLDARSGYQVQRGNGSMFHICLDDGTCQGGRGEDHAHV